MKYFKFIKKLYILYKEEKYLKIKYVCISR